MVKYLKVNSLIRYIESSAHCSKIVNFQIFIDIFLKVVIYITANVFHGGYNQDITIKNKGDIK